ncbi:MAG: CDP-diacylglycerol diphosphatase [Enterobacteriaceae bacterium]|nr:CDP-diacylglycerol diphosphatase [Enterobacteriaceae bacterium]
MIVILVILSGYWAWVFSHSDDLWNIISQQCISQQQLNQIQIIPCLNSELSSDASRGFVIFKDRKGPLHFLLIPTERIKGVEDKRLLNPDTPDYFMTAWDYRSYLSKQSGKRIPRDVVSLAINSAWGRSQDQLHIHVSCVKPEIKAQLESQLDKFSEKWTPVPYGINNHNYIARTLTEEQFQQMSLIRRVAAELPDAAKNMGEYGIALVAYNKKDFKNKTSVPMYLMLVNKVDLLGLNLGYAEEIQDYQCDLVKTSQML